MFESLWTENSLHGRVGREITTLHRLLTLADVHDPSRPEAAYFAALDPSSPHLEEISLLAGELQQALDETYASQSQCADDEETTNG